MLQRILPPFYYFEGLYIQGVLGTCLQLRNLLPCLHACKNHTKTIYVLLIFGTKDEKISSTSSNFQCFVKKIVDLKQDLVSTCFWR